jgi:hypothetical protein
VPSGVTSVGAPRGVWVELAPPPLWLETAAVDMFAGCSEVLAMVGRAWVDGWWKIFGSVV